MRIKSRLLLLGILLLTMATLFFTMSDLFIVRKFEIMGNQVYDSSFLDQNTTIRLGENGFLQLIKARGFNPYLRFTKEEDRLVREWPYLAKITIHYQLPDTVVFILTEREPAFYIHHLSGYPILDKEGVVLEIHHAPARDLIHLTGVSIQSYSVGRKLDVDDHEKWDVAYEIMRTVQKMDQEHLHVDSFFDRIVEINLSDQREIYITLQDKTVAVIPLKANLSTVMRTFYEIYHRSILGRTSGVLDFTTSTPVFSPHENTSFGS